MSPAFFLLRKNRAGRTRAGCSLHPLPAAVPRSPVGAAGVEFLLLHLPLKFHKRVHPG